jgi:hypothetical protein
LFVLEDFLIVPPGRKIWGCEVTLDIRRYSLGSLASLIGFSFLLLCGVPTSIAVSSIFVLVVQIASGYQIFKFVFKVNNSKLSEILSFGFTFGSIVSFISAQAFLNTRIESIGWLIPAVFIAILKLVRQQDQMRMPANLFHVELRTLFLATAVAILFLCLDYLWCQIVFIVLSAGTISCLLIKRMFRSKYVVSFLIFSTFVFCCYLLTTIVKSRNPSWWAISDDFGFFEALQNSIAEFGFYDKWGTFGDNWSSYHFLVYGITGTLDKIVAAPAWIVLGQIGPAMFAFFLAVSLVNLWEICGVRNSPITAITLVSFPFFFFYSYTSPSFVFGEIIMVQVITIFLSKSSQRGLHIPWTGACLMAFVAFYSKMTNTPQLSFLLFTLVFSQITRHGWVFIKQLSSEIIFLLTSVCLFVWTTAFNSDVKGRIDVISLAGFAYERVGSLQGLTIWYERYFAVALVIGRYVLLPTIACLAVWRLAKHRSELLAHLLIPVSASALILCIVTGRGNAGYFSTAALQTSYLLTLLIACRLSENSFPIRIYKLFYFFGITFGVISICIAQRFNGGSFRDVAGMALGKSNLLLVLVFPLLCFCLTSTRSYVRGRKSKFVFPLFLFFLVGAVVGQGVMDMRRPVRGPELSKSDFAIALGTKSEQETGFWLKNNTPNYSLVASNHGIDDTNFMLPIFSERRFLIQGPRFVGGNQISESVLSKIQLTKNFAADPSESHTRALLSAGVDYFVLDLWSSKLSRRDFKLNPIFESNEFLVLDLRNLLSD